MSDKDKEKLERLERITRERLERIGWPRGKHVKPLPLPSPNRLMRK